MWYVIQTFIGQEEKTADMIRTMVISDFIEDCFVLKREKLKKFHGRWNKVEEVLFQGYVFVISGKPKELYEELKHVPKAKGGLLRVSITKITKPLYPR